MSTNSHVPSSKLRADRLHHLLRTVMSWRQSKVVTTSIDGRTEAANRVDHGSWHWSIRPRSVAIADQRAEDVVADEVDTERGRHQQLTALQRAPVSTTRPPAVSDRRLRRAQATQSAAKRIAPRQAAFHADGTIRAMTVVVVTDAGESSRARASDSISSGNRWNMPSRAPDDRALQAPPRPRATARTAHARRPDQLCGGLVVGPFAHHRSSVNVGQFGKSSGASADAIAEVSRADRRGTIGGDAPQAS